MEGGDLVGTSTAEMAKEVLVSLKLADPEQGHYSGPVVVTDGDVVIQDAGRGAGVVHQLDLLGDMPNLGASVEVRYSRGVGKVVGREEQQRGKGGRGVAA